MFAAVGGPSLAVLLIGWQVQPEIRRNSLVRRAKIGVWAGIAGLAAYDIVRWLVVLATGSALNPFEAFPVFGELLIGDASHSAQFAAGIGYHVFNGIGFAVFFAVVVRRHSIAAGIAWAFFLEIATLAIYPGWLNIGASRKPSATQSTTPPTGATETTEASTGTTKSPTRSSSKTPTARARHIARGQKARSSNDRVG
jgi:hypothetical protein